MKIAVTGSQGKLGTALVQRGCTPVLGDITVAEEINDSIQAISPDVLIHCAALTNVAYCESHPKEAFEVNVRGTVHVFDAMPKNCVMLYMSSDHVFCGENWFNQGYSESHTPQPVNIYGYTKWGGELITGSTFDFGKRRIVVRTSRCYDYEWMKPTIDILNLGGEAVFTDLIKRSFMYVPHFTDAILWLAENTEKLTETDIINISGDMVLSHYMFWHIMKDSLNLGGEIFPRREKLKDAEPRPFRAGLDVKYARKLGVPLHNMQEAINDLKKRMLND